MLFKSLIVISTFFLLWGCSGKEGSQSGESAREKISGTKVHTISLSAWAIGPEPTSMTRITNLETVVADLNQELLAQNKKIVLETEFWKGNHEDFKRKFLSAFKADLAPDILLAGHENIALLAENDHILALDDFIRQDKTGTFEDFFESLWDAVRYRGKLYGIVQDTESRMIYYRKDVLALMGWSKKRIEEFPAQVEAGNITLDDIVKIAREAQDKKLVDWGIYHRPTLGPNFFHYIFAYGGKIQDEKSGKLVISKAATLKTLAFFSDLVHKHKVTPKEMSTFSWSIMDGAIPKRQILFNITGGSWNRSEYIFEQGMTPLEFQDKVGFCLIPAVRKKGRPVTLSHPMVYMVNKRTLQPELVMRILTMVSDSKLNLRHALGSSHLAIRKSEMELPDYQADSFLVEATRILKYTRFAPTHPSYAAYSEQLFKAIARTQLDGISAASALEELTNNMQEATQNTMLILP